MRKLSVIFIIAGILTALYPLGERAYRGHRQQILLEELTDSLQAGMRQTGETEEVPGGDKIIAGESGDNKNTVTSELNSAEGILFIETIGLRVPLLRGMSEKNLKAGAAILEGSADIGQEGNTVVAAHRTHVYGRLFNRLNELQAGDRLVIVTFDGEYEYLVYSNLVVTKEDVSVLDWVKGERILTLITCHPLNRVNPPFRLVVKAKLINSPS